MIRIGMAILALGLIAQSAGAQTAPSPAPALKNQKEKLSYAIGMEMGKGVMAQGLDVDPGLVAQGLKDAISGGKALMSDDELRTVISAASGRNETEANASDGGGRRG